MVKTRLPHDRLLVIVAIIIHATAVFILGQGVSSPDSKVHGANMGPTWVLAAPDGPHVGPMNLFIRVWIGVK